MTTALTEFKYEGNTIRTFGTKLEPWFVAVDVLGELGISTKYMARTLRGLDDDEKMVIDLSAVRVSSPIKLMGEAEIVQGSHNMVWIVSEPGFYKIALRARTEKAKAFTRKVTHEILPSIRQYGYYVNPSWGRIPPDGLWQLKTGEKLRGYEVQSRAIEMGLPRAEEREIDSLVYEIDEVGTEWWLRKRYPYTEEDISKISRQGDSTWYDGMLPTNEGISEYMKRFKNLKTREDEMHFSEKFVEFVKRIDAEEDEYDF